MSTVNHPTGKEKQNRLRIENRFWEKVDIGSDDECWEWEAAINAHGYGRFRVDDVVVNAHRAALALDKESIKLLREFNTVRHACDNRSCCNPRHLSEGSHKDNMLDMSERGRTSTQKLDASDAKEIKQRYAEDDVSQCELAAEYGVSQNNISNIVRGESFTFLD